MPLHYKDYLQLDKILHAQQPETGKNGQEPAHEEMLFIIIHQAYELWFKQVIYELDAILLIMGNETINDNSPDFQLIIQRLKRVVTIFKLLVQQIDVLETMTPMDFLSFRDHIRPASGFQSWQFKNIEAKLGLKYEHRHGQEFYASQLKQDEVDVLKKSENEQSLLQRINIWLERMPFINDEDYWENYHPMSGNQNTPKFWNDYEYVYLQTLLVTDSQGEASFKDIFNHSANAGNRNRTLSPMACRSALFINVYRGYPLLELPFQLLDTLLEVDSLIATWRFRHVNMIQRMIGVKMGTGGSAGAGYLKAALEKHYIFKEIALLNSFLVEKQKLPKLPQALIDKLTYRV
jgi:tryptophan 2,3-dioxygenase